MPSMAYTLLDDELLITELIAGKFLTCHTFHFDLQSFFGLVSFGDSLPWNIIITTHTLLKQQKTGAVSIARTCPFDPDQTDP